MAYAFAILQLAAYLFIVPLIRLCYFEYDLDVNYTFGLALVFSVAFFLGAILATKSGSRPSDIGRNRLPEFSAIGQFAVVVWAGLYILIAINYELVDRRIGTENAAALVAAIPPTVTVFYRSFEVAVPLFLSVIVLRYSTLGRLTVCDWITLLVILVAFGMSGAANSRSQFAYLVMAVLVIVQNSMPRRRFSQLLVAAVAFACAALLLVSVARISKIDDFSTEDYISTEVLKRLDGLELISEVIEERGIAVLGIAPGAAYIPLVAGIPFLARAQELKEDALTNVKAVILANELGSSKRDVNSFVLVDPYYWGGLVGLISVGVLLGVSTRLVDRHIGRTAGWGWQLLLVAMAVNLVVLEREAIAIGFAVLRDWGIFCAVALVVFRRGADHATVLNGKVCS